MKIPEALKTEKAEMAFSAAFVFIVLIILPMLPLGKYGGGIAMVAASILGLIAYLVLFGERLRSRGGLKIITVAVIVGAIAVGVALLLTRGHR